MYNTKMNSIVILFLMIITGFIIYYMYLKPETFDCITNPSAPECIPTLPASFPTLSESDIAKLKVTMPNIPTGPNIPTMPITKTIPKSIVSNPTRRSD